MGHITEAFTDEQLLTIADVCGVDDNTLRKMHMDHLPPRPLSWQTPCGLSKPNMAAAGN
ncbi:hypothetical protein ACFS4T_20910 [Pseudomonas lini]